MTEWLSQGWLVTCCTCLLTKRRRLFCFVMCYRCLLHYLMQKIVLFCHVLQMFTPLSQCKRLFCHVLQMFTPLSQCKRLFCFVMCYRCLLHYLNAKDCFVVTCYRCLLHYLSAKDCFVLSRATDIYYIISVQKIVLFCHVLQTFTTLSQCKRLFCFVTCYRHLLHYLSAKDCFVLSRATDIYYIISVHT